MWKAFKIGAGKLIAWNEIIFCPQEATCHSEENLFLPISAQEMDKTTTHYGRVDDVSGIFKYPHPPCSKEFCWKLFEVWLQITALWRRYGAACMTSYESIGFSASRGFHWILKESHASSSNWNHNRTGRKEDPAQVANNMRNARNTDDTRTFSKMEWLSKLQIQGFFSRVSAKRKQSGGKETSSHGDEPDDSEELAEEYASLTDEEMLEKASVAIQSEIGVKRLVMYDACLQPLRNGIWKQTFIFQG